MAKKKKAKTAKPRSTIRRPGTTAAAGAVAQFVSGGRANDRSVVPRKGKPDRRITTVYFPPDLITRLKIYLAINGGTISNTVTAALTEYLNARE